MLKFFSKALIASVITFTSVYVGASSSNPIVLKVATFNVLAPCWALLKYYPPHHSDNSYNYVTDTKYRLSKIQKELDILKKEVDVFCFQEVTEDFFKAIGEILGSKFRGFISYNDISYWGDQQLDTDKPVLNGNATFLNTEKWDIVTTFDISTYPTDGSGNHAMYVKITKKNNPQDAPHFFSITNVHFDNVSVETRKKELEGTIGFVRNEFGEKNHTTLIVGDLNDDTDEKSSIFEILSVNDFKNIRTSVELTKPFVDSPSILDHILVRNGNAVGNTEVRNHGIWLTYPVKNPDIDRNQRIISNFDACGSDHFPVVGSVQVNQ